VNGRQHRLLEVPPGVQCFVGDEVRRRRAIERQVLAIFEGWSYEEIIPPLFDYADVFSGPALSARTYSFVGRDGSLLALRPDFTSLLAKIAAGRLGQRPAPLRLYYSGEVLRYELPRAGRQGELFQMGLELLGGEERAADAEVLAVAAECLTAIGAQDWVLALGHVGVFGGLLEGSALDAAQLDALRERVESKSPDGIREVLHATHVAPEVTEAVVKLADLSGGVSVLDDARDAFVDVPAARAAVDDLAGLVAALVEAGLGEHLAIDLGEVRGLDYYTGLVVRIYVRGLGFEVGSGGRYDGLLGRFGRPLPAVGLMFGLDPLAAALEQRPGPEARVPRAATVRDADLGRALVRAIRERAAGTRVRLEAGDEP